MSMTAASTMTRTEVLHHHGPAAHARIREATPALDVAREPDGAGAVEMAADVMRTRRPRDRYPPTRARSLRRAGWRVPPRGSQPRREPRGRRRGTPRAR